MADLKTPQLQEEKTAEFRATHSTQYGDTKGIKKMPLKVPEDMERKGRAPSTWAALPFSEKNFWQKLASLDLAPAEVYEEKPGFDRGPVPHHSIIRENAFILSMGLLPVWLQMASYYFFPDFKWPIGFAFPVYNVAFIVFLVANVRRLHAYMVKYGTFDEGVRARDIVSDRHVDKLAYTILTAIMIRTAAPFLIAYRAESIPQFSLWSPVKIGLWLICIDFWFYNYHRMCHEVPWLWFVHRTHHGTKHPTPLLTILADDYQDVIEIVAVPLLATACVRLSFFEGWAAVVYQLYVEMLGHSGIRAYWSHPVLTPVLKPFHMELAVEDHDLHHRYGRGGKNYGKQTRIFDTIFGTVGPREDCTQK